MEIKRKRKNNFKEINMTPFVDTTLVLLIIFMLTAPLLDQGNDVNLPVAKGVNLRKKEKPLVIKVNNKKKIFLNNTEINLNTLETRMALILKKRKNKDVFLKADKNIRYGFVAKLVSKLKTAGSERVGLVTLPPEFKDE